VRKFKQKQREFAQKFVENYSPDRSNSQGLAGNGKKIKELENKPNVIRLQTIVAQQKLQEEKTQLLNLQNNNNLAETAAANNPNAAGTSLRTKSANNRTAKPPQLPIFPSEIRVSENYIDSARSVSDNERKKLYQVALKKIELRHIREGKHYLNKTINS
jgi:hypothetical protein